MRVVEGLQCQPVLVVGGGETDTPGANSWYRHTAPLLPPTPPQTLIKQYSEFISFPIKLWVKTSQPEQVVDEEATAKAQASPDWVVGQRAGSGWGG